jgi:large subunit ribosomal protein L4
MPAMLSANLYNAQGQKAGTIEVAEQVFQVPVNKHLLYLAVRRHLDNRRQGTASTQDATDVRGGGKKPFTQKHTGRARQGSNRSSLMVGGYVAHGPTPRDYYWELPKGMKRQALRSALSDCLQTGRLQVIEAVAATGKTKEMQTLMAAMALGGKKVLLLDAKPSAEVLRAGRNIRRLAIRAAAEATPYEILKADTVVLTKPGLTAIQEALSR